MEDSAEKTGVIYCRVSSAEQVDGTSLAMQERNCREYAAKGNIKILNVFIEEGESAKSADRTQFQKALAFCSNKKAPVNYFIVHKVDRFARNRNDHVVTQMHLKRYGIKLRAVAENIDETPTGKLMEGILASFAEFDNDIRSGRSKSGMEERLRQGVWVWRAPMGYKRLTEGGNLVIDEKVAPYIKLAFEEYSKGTHSLQSLADFLSDRGFRTSSGKRAFPQLMQHIIHNPLYCAQIRVWGLEIKGTFEEIVSEELFEKCQPSFRKFGAGNKREADNPDFPLRRLTVCSECSTALTGSFSTGRKGVKYGYYHHHKQGCTQAASIPKGVLEQNFVEYLQEVGPNAKYEKIFKAVVLDVWQSNYKKLDAENARVRKEIEQFEIERQSVFDLHIAGKYSDEEFFEQKKRVNAKINERKFLLQEKQIEEFDMEVALDFCFRYIRNGGKTWQELGEFPAFRARFQKSVFPAKVNFDGEKFGTKKIAMIYKLKGESGNEKTDLVRPLGFEPRTFSLKGSRSTD
jgi:site-specific DNA recombinase